MLGGSRDGVKPARAWKAIVSTAIDLWDNDRKANAKVEQKEFFADVPTISVNVSIFDFSAMVGIVSIAPNVGSAMVAWISALLIGVAAFLAPFEVTAEEQRSRSMRVLEQSDLRGSFCHAVFSGLRSAPHADGRSATLHTESVLSLPLALT